MGKHKPINQLRVFTFFIGISLILSACQSQAATSPAPIVLPSETLPAPATITPLPASATPVPTDTATPAPTLTATPASGVPNFSHITIIVFENKEFGSVIGNSQMPTFNRLANEYTLLTQYYGVRHPSLPNYLAMIGGSTFNITTDCETCYVNAPSLPDLIENSGRTWKGYMEDMPSPCFIGSRVDYAQKHDPFIYFDAIRQDTARCQSHVVPLTQLKTDLENKDIPNFAFITPNECNDAHSCPVATADKWLDAEMSFLMSTPLYDPTSLIVLTWDEGQGDHSCCGLPTGGGRVATVLISPLAQAGFQDDTPYSHYSLLKTIAAAWGLPELDNAADPQTNLIVKPWKH